MKEKLVTIETAKLAKEKGFEWEVHSTFEYDEDGKLLEFTRIRDRGEVFFFYANFNDKKSEDYEYLVSRPSQTILQKWLREVHNLYVIVQDYYWENSVKYFITRKKYSNSKMDYSSQDHVEFTNYEEALEYALYEALKHIKDNESRINK